jgi:hypothetical protein
MTKIARICSAAMLTLALSAWANNEETAPAAPPPKKIQPQLKLPYERPIGFTLNVGGISSMTFEGRFLLGLFPHILLVASPSYQNTPEFPWYHPKHHRWSVFDIKRFNTGLGLRGHFYEYDSWDGFYIEAMGRGGVTWIGKEDYMWSVIPSLIFGYAAVYDSGYTVSFGLGFEWEFLLDDNKGYHSEFLRTAYYGITKLPLTGELSLGWTW